MKLSSPLLLLLLLLLAPLQKTQSFSSLLYQKLKKNFQGDFDNYKQVLLDRENNREPGASGGHEHIHCTLLPLPCPDNNDDSSSLVIAAYYFDGLPDKIFRFRLYELFCDESFSGASSTTSSSVEEEEEQVRMKLYTFRPNVEKHLREYSSNPLSWLDVLMDYPVENNDRSVDSILEATGQYIEGCDILWASSPHPTRHAYLTQTDHNLLQIPNNNINNDGIHAVMIQESVTLPSTMIPGLTINIKDELSLFDNYLCINDRGFDSKTNKFVYGNWKGIPYGMERVACFTFEEEEGCFVRHVVNEELQWTLAGHGMDHSL